MNIEEGTACCRKDAARGGNDIGKMKKVSEMRQKGFYRHYPSGGWPLYCLLLAYVVAGWFWPVVGWALLFYIIGTVATAFWRGRWWCGHVCPRGNMYLRLLSRYSPHRQIPPPCPNDRFSSVCRDCCLHLLWNWNLQYLGRLLGHGRCVLADDTHNHSHWHRALLRLCTDDVVQLLSYRVSCGMGSSKERAPAERVYSCLHRRWVRRQVPDMRPCLSDATDSLQKP